MDKNLYVLKCGNVTKLLFSHLSILYNNCFWNPININNNSNKICFYNNNKIFFFILLLHKKTNDNLKYIKLIN